MTLLLAALLTISLPSFGATEPWCTWTDAPYTGWAGLRFPGTDLVWGRASGDRISLSGELGGGQYGPTLSAELRQGGVTVRADLRASDGLLFRAGAPVMLGPIGLIGEGSVVEPVGWMAGGAVMVAGDHYAMDEVDARVEPFGALTCGQLLLSGRFNKLDEDAAVKEALGVTEQTERAHLKTRRVALRALPGLTKSATFKAGDYPREVAVLERRGADVRVAYVHYSGLAWYGWVRAKDLLDPEDAPSGEGDGILGAMGRGSKEELRRCDVDLPLRARVGEHEAEVGTLAAGTSFLVRDATGEGAVSVQLTRSWLLVERDAALLLPREALDCASETRPQGGVEGLLEELSAP